MRSSNLVYLVILIISVFIMSGCDKDRVEPVNYAPVEKNTAPKVFAGHDIWLLVPANTAQLSGSVIDDENNVNTYLWKQLSGDPTSIIDKPNLPTTKVSNLQKGDYAFELSATDAVGLTTRDTVALFVKEPAEAINGEVIFKNLEWQCPMGCTVQISCLSCHVPVNKPFKVFLKDNVDQWIEAQPEANWKQSDKYSFSIHNNNLYIYTNDATG